MVSFTEDIITDLTTAGKFTFDIITGEVGSQVTTNYKATYTPANGETPASWTLEVVN